MVEIPLNMNARKAITGLIVVVLLAITSAGAACDVSCAFAPAGADCHSSGVTTASAASPAMDMGGMDMPGMDYGQSDLPVSGASRARSPHVSAGDMEVCERQVCGNDAFIFARAGQSDAPMLPSIVLGAPIRAAGPLFLAFHRARDTFAPRALFDDSPSILILRI